MTLFDIGLDKEEKQEQALTNGRTDERPTTAHCLFEQSGTFKNEFIKLGIPSYDYDILNDYGETDYQIDLFAEIEKAYNEEPSVFDKFKTSDVIMAFFPCVRFENQIMLSFRGQLHGMETWSAERKMKYDMKLLDEVNAMYKAVNKLFITCIKRGLKLIMENPYSEEHFLRRYWCCPSTIIDKDRRKNGDYYAKPTQYWFLNIEPTYSVIFEPIPDNALDVKDAIRMMKKEDWEKTRAKSTKQARSMIHPQYANRFIRQFIL